MADAALADKQAYTAFWSAFRHRDAAAQTRAVHDFFADRAQVNVAHPVNDLSGPEGVIAGFLDPLLRAFEGLYYRPDISIGGNSFDGSAWTSGMGYLVGTFRRDWLGIAPTDQLAYIRIGDFHRMENGQAVESYIYLDLPELLMQIGRYPLGTPQGACFMVPGPATHDGLRTDLADPDHSARTYQIMVDMLDGLATPDEAWRPYWHPNMMWYGPASFGRFVGIEEFQRFQVPFEAAFEGWGGGMSPRTPTKHFTRFADGDYSCIGGWPSLQGTHTGSYLGFEPTGVTTRFRVCDWYRREGDLLVENWVFVDLPDALLQWGYDMMAEQAKL
ncbi:SnoaL-like polyketide cyclase [Litoreibacter ponti]|uniref:SnoaL-like polyketide cyclase n=1 Tax=Litoreibacter ponti TaxID=1510457 RepID=A0A2T6BHI3_9RHOB|nr:ester cyclase [Litoreibacter ponti]PTX55533.1 SnoaL-like polyketide cyclase [Litoreibacter ponti]